MKRMFLRIMLMVFPIFAIWLFVLAFRYNFDLSDVHINLYATVKQFESFASDNLYEIFQNMMAQFSNLDFNYNYEYTEITDMLSFFSNVGTWFNGTFKNLIGYLNGTGTVLKAFIDLFVYLIKLIIQLFNVVFNPVVY